MQQQGRQVGRAVIARFVVVGQVYEAGGADLIQNNADVFGDIADAIDADDITDAQAMQRPDIKCAFDDIDLAAGAGDLMLEGRPACRHSRRARPASARRTAI